VTVRAIQERSRGSRNSSVSSVTPDCASPLGCWYTPASTMPVELVKPRRERRTGVDRRAVSECADVRRERSLSAGSAASPAAFSVPVVPAIDPDDTSVSPKSVEGIRSHRPDESGTAIRKRRAFVSCPAAKAKGESATRHRRNSRWCDSTTSATSSSSEPYATLGVDQRVRDTLTRKCGLPRGGRRTTNEQHVQVERGRSRAEATLAPVVP